MIIYFELLTVLFLVAMPSLSFCLFKKKFSYETKSLVRNILCFLGVTLLILYIGSRQQTGLISIGVDLKETSLLLAGVPLAILFLIFYGFIIKLPFLKEKPTSDEIESYNKEVLSIKSPLQRSLLIICVLLAAVAKELVYRGYFILIWGQRTDFPILCAGISSILFIILHLWYGKKLIPFYTIMTIFFVIPVLYANTILVSMGMHIFINLAMTIVALVPKKKKESETVVSSSKNTIPKEKPIPNSRIAIILFICSWFAAPISLFLYAIPSALIIILAICDIIRIKKSRGKIIGIGFCIATIVISTFPILAVAAWFLLPPILDMLFSII